MDSADILQVIRTRRVHYYYKEQPLPEEVVWTILEAARWAPTANNQRVHRYVCLADQRRIRQLQFLSPGFVATTPAALIIVCIDRDLAEEDTLEPAYHNYIDVGTAAQNMLLAAHSMGIASGIVTSFAREAVQILCNLPESWSPEMFVLLGYAAEPPAHAPQWPRSTVRVEDLVHWGDFPGGSG